MVSGKSNLLTEVIQMIVCFGCGGFIDVRDRFCRWCGRTIIFDNSEPSRPYAIVSPSRNMKKQPAAVEVKEEVCPHCQKTIKTVDPERSVIGRALALAIFHDDEEEFNNALDLLCNPPSARDAKPV